MPDAPLSLFISYSRTDSTFVDRLEADLKARSFRPWVDRRKLEGGQDWMDELQNAIDRCQIIVVVVSPDAVQSEYVRMEYRYGRGQGKPIIPAYCRTTPKVPIDLNGIQWVNFQSSYDQGLADLLIALSRQEIAALPPAKPHPSTSLPSSLSEPVLVTPQPAPPAPNIDLNELYRAGVAAKAQGDLERTAIFWQQVLARDPHFGNGILAPQMKRLMIELHPLRVQRIREQAKQAHRSGAWGQEIGAWQALLGLEPEDTQAKERLPVAQHHQQYAWMYENAQEFARVKNLAALREQLALLWQGAPDYGDPAGLAKIAGICTLSGLDWLVILGSKPLTIGRSRNNGLVCANLHVSSRHAEIQPVSVGRYQVVDVGSVNGTKLNGVKLAAGVPQPLSVGDIILLGGSGGVELRFE